MIKLKRTLFFFLALLCVTGRVNAADIYVDNQLSENCIGRYNIAERTCPDDAQSGIDAYRRIAGIRGSNGIDLVSEPGAVDVMNGGDDIYLRGGTYHESDIHLAGANTPFNNTSGIPDAGEPDGINWSTMQSYPGEWAIIDGQRQCGASAVENYTNNVHAVIRNGAFAATGETQSALEGYARYWKFERLEITGGGFSGSTDVEDSAAGIWWVGGPVQVRYCYVHDNLANAENGNPAGFNGASLNNSIIEYNYFRNNGSALHEADNSRNICTVASTEYACGGISDCDIRYAEWWHFIRRNEIRYNLVEANGDVGIATKAHQELTETRDRSDTSRMDWGDKIHHNIVLNADIYSIEWLQDYVQIYNNIIVKGDDAGEESWGISTHQVRAESDNTLQTVIYNNTLQDTHAAAIYNGYWVYNNIIDSHTDDYDRDEISFGADFHEDDGTSYKGIVQIDRNYFYSSIYDEANSGDDYCYIKIGDTEDNATDRYTISRYENDFPGTNLYEGSGGSLYQGTSGADQYIAIGSHQVEGSTTIADGGIGGVHPYLVGVTIPSYVGATNPDDNAWVAGVLGLANLSNMQNALEEDPPWIEGENSSSDIVAPSVPDNLEATAVSSSQIDLAWDDATDNVGVAGYRIFRDNTPVETTIHSRYSDTGLDAGTTHTYTVTAYDAAGNESIQSGAANSTTLSSSNNSGDSSGTGGSGGDDSSGSSGCWIDTLVQR